MTETVSQTPERFTVTENTVALNAKYKPGAIGIMQYALPNVLGHSEYEELAARIIEMAQEEGQFIAPSWKTLATQIFEELQEEIRREEARRPQMKKPQSEEKPAEQIRGLRAGIEKLLGLFGKSPVAAKNVAEDKKENTPEPQSEIMQEEELPFSVIRMNLRFNPNSLANDVREMIEKGYLNIVRVDEIDFLEPTEKLIGEIMTAQETRRKERGEIINL